MVLTLVSGFLLVLSSFEDGLEGFLVLAASVLLSLFQIVEIVRLGVGCRCVLMDVSHVALVLVYVSFVACLGLVGKLECRSVLVGDLVSLVEVSERASLQWCVLEFGLLAESVLLGGLRIGAIDIKVCPVDLHIVLGVLLDPISNLLGCLILLPGQSVLFLPKLSLLPLIMWVEVKIDADLVDVV